MENSENVLKRMKLRCSPLGHDCRVVLEYREFPAKSCLPDLKMPAVPRFC